MKKIISFVLSLVILFAVAMPSSAVVTVSDAPDALKSAIDLHPLSLDASSINAYAVSDDGTTALLGSDTDGNDALWFMDGYTVTKCDTDLAALAMTKMDIPTGDEIYGGDYVSFSDVYYFGGAFYVVAESSYYCMCDEGPHEFTGLCVLLRTENGTDFTAVKMPSFSEPMFIGVGGVSVSHFGDKLIYAPNAGGFTVTGESTDENGYPVKKGVAYYYTSLDGLGWIRHTSPEIEDNDMESLFWLFEDIADDGTAVFQLFSEAPTMTGGFCYGYYVTSDLSTYTKLPEDVFGDEYNYNRINLSRSGEYTDGEMALLLQTPQEMDEETFELKTTGFNVYAVDSADGEWVQKIDYDGQWKYYRYYFTDNDACIMLMTTGGTTYVYNWSGANGSVTTDTTSINITLISGGVGRSYNDTMVFYMLYNGNNLLVSKDMWRTGVRVDLGREFTSAVGIDNKLILVGDSCYAIDLDAAGAAYIDGIVGGGESEHPGDADESGAVNLTDVSLIMKKVAGWSVTINEKLADVTADGAVNLADASLMLKYIAGWDVTLG